ncbi:Protein lysine methyltransferase-like protein [Euroglyphus maynei]|uniref:Protein lysine methyltransferase-like protein n=1 Tax=Euroglyphus maynei TaxID=6958 RepID=A0A1Y3B1D4_EURMA|nr:Protein lysine methyltransferase-like protein [Euroglyphus maynei]
MIDSNQTLPTLTQNNSDNNNDDECKEFNDNDYYYIDGADPDKSNWMRFVNPAYSSIAQNLVACQVEQAIYFYTIRPIPPDQELLVWYCREFAQRLNYPLTGEQMMLRIPTTIIHVTNIKSES